VLFAVIFSCPRLSTSEEERFFWSADFVSKPNNYYHGAPSQIPVIGGEVVEIQCQVRAVSEDPYSIIWDYENFNANTTGKTILVNNTAGDEFAVDTVTVNIDNPAVIDDKDIICSWENGKFSDTISLQFKVYVVEDKSKKGTCSVCEGAEHVKLVRPGKEEKKEDANMKEKIKEKAKKIYGKSGFSEVFIDSKGSVCCCKATDDPITSTTTTTTTTTTTSTTKSTTTTTTTTKEAPIMTETPKITEIIRKTAITTTTTTTAKTTTTTASTTVATTTTGWEQIILRLRNFILPIVSIVSIYFLANFIS